MKNDGNGHEAKAIKASHGEGLESVRIRRCKSVDDQGRNFLKLNREERAHDATNNCDIKEGQRPKYQQNETPC